MQLSELTHIHLAPASQYLLEIHRTKTNGTPSCEVSKSLIIYWGIHKDSSCPIPITLDGPVSSVSDTFLLTVLQPDGTVFTNEGDSPGKFFALSEIYKSFEEWFQVAEKEILSQEGRDLV